MCYDANSSITVFKDADEQGLVSFAVPPVCWDLGVERLRNPDVQHAVEQKQPAQHFLQ